MKKKIVLIITACVAVIAITATVLAVVFLNSSSGKKKIIKKKVIVVNNSAETNSDTQDDDFQNDDYSDDYNSDTGYEDTANSNSGLENGMFYVSEKKTADDIGKNYYVVSLKYDHPGVVGYDADYEVVVRDKMGNTIPNKELNITVSSKKVKNKSGNLTIPYSVRNGNDKVVVSVVNKRYPKLTGKFTFDFKKFSKNATFKENFNKLDSDKWVYQKTNKVPSDKAYIKDGSLVLKSESSSGITNIVSAFKQSYGCFTANVKMHNKGLANFVFSLRTEQRYVKNEAMVVESGGEITGVEYFPYWKDKWSSCVRWFGWNSYSKKSRNDDLICKNISVLFHKYSVVWTPDSIFWYLDGKLVNSYSGEGVGKGSNAMNICLKLTSYDKDNYRGGPFEPDAFPVTVMVDSIEAYGLIN